MAFTIRKGFVWQLKTRSLALGARTCVMGVLNVTPDSFSDGGLHFDTATAIEHGLALLDAGADIVDIGGESTRPGRYEPVTAAMEQARVLPVIAGILKQRPHAVVSIDTYHAETALAAVSAGAEIVNDVSGLQWDPVMAGACARLGCGVVITHTRGRPEEWKHLPRLKREEIVPLVERELGERLRTALDAGIARERIVLDPGFGFGKVFDENYVLLAGMETLRGLDRPLLAALSRKSFLGRTLAELHGGSDAAVAERGPASLAAMVAAILAGAHVVRVHQVRPAVEAARIADALAAALPTPHG